MIGYNLNEIELNTLLFVFIINKKRKMICLDSIFVTFHFQLKNHEKIELNSLNKQFHKIKFHQII